MTLSFLKMMTIIQIPFLTHDVLILKMMTFQISFLIYDFSKVAFHHASPKVMIQLDIVRTYVFHLLGTYVTTLCNLLIL